MLVLSRQRGQAVIARTIKGETVRFSVQDIRGDKVRIGIEADPETQVNREEVQREIDLTNGQPRAIDDFVAKLKRGSRRGTGAA